MITDITNTYMPLSGPAVSTNDLSSNPFKINNTIVFQSSNTTLVRYLGDLFEFSTQSNEQNITSTYPNENCIIFDDLTLEEISSNKKRKVEDLTQAEAIAPLRSLKRRKIQLPVKIWPIKLANIGNSCYLNASLQLVLSISELRERIYELASDNLFINALKDIDQSPKAPSKTQLKHLRSEMFKKALKGQLTQGETEQQDAHESLTFILNQLNWFPLKIQACSVGGIDDPAVLYNDVQESNSISIEIAPGSFQNLIDKYFEFETMSFKKVFPSETGEDVEYSTWKRAFEIREYSKYFFVHLKRFDNKNSKNRTEIEFPKDKLLQIGKMNYEIAGWLSHDGRTAALGHYTATVKNENNKWSHCNDADVFKLDEPSISGRNAYLLLLKQLA